MNVIILGAGPAGLTAASQLSNRGVSCRTFERDDQVGGLAKTLEYRGCRFDVGGHRFYTKSRWVDRFWRDMLGPDLIRVNRLSRIFYKGQFFQYPLQLGQTLRTLGLTDSTRVFMSYLKARVLPRSEETSFEDYVVNRFGHSLYDIFFKSYTEKVWGIPGHQIRAEWAAQRIRGVSLFSAVLKAAGFSGSGAKSLIEAFDYPRLGPGMLWEATREAVERSGNGVLLQHTAIRLTHRQDRVDSVELQTPVGLRVCKATDFLSSLPLKHLVHMLSPPAPTAVQEAAVKLKYRDLIVINLIVDEPAIFPDNWIYVHSPRARVARIQNYKNWSSDMVPDPARTSLGLEYFCSVGDDLWKHSDQRLLELACRDLDILDLAQGSTVIDGFVVRVRDAYPVYDREYREQVETIRNHLDRFSNLQSMGRNGLNRYNNQDHSMLCARAAVQNLWGAGHDLWELNTDQEYQEEVSPSAPAAPVEEIN